MSFSFVRRCQRRVLRRSVRLECEVVREHDFKLVGRRAVDLSCEGMLVLADAKVLTGEELIVSFRAPVTQLWFDCQATVARVVHGRRPGDWGQCLGLEFCDLDSFARSMLSAELRGFPPPVPRREPRIDYAATVQRLMAN
jgi:hypothetical protein